MSFLRENHKIDKWSEILDFYEFILCKTIQIFHKIAISIMANRDINIKGEFSQKWQFRLKNESFGVFRNST